MKKLSPWADYQTPILTDNRRFREEIPAVNQHFEAAKKEMDQFPRVGGVIVAPEIVDFVGCPVCGWNNPEQLFVRFGIIYAECPLCTNIFVRNRLKEHILLHLYETSVVDKFDRKVQQSPQHNEYYSKIYGKYLSFAEGLNITNRNLLDIGCGAGQFLKFCSENTDYKLHGSDFCDDSVSYLQQLIGKENYYYRKKIEEVDFAGKKFGLITLWGVLEHVPNPRDIFGKCSTILDDNGFILILIPNIHSRAFSILGVETPTVNPRAHLNFYTRKSLQILCQQTGLEIHSFFQELPVIDLMYPHIDYSPELIAGILRRNEAYYHIYFFKKAGSRA